MRRRALPSSGDGRGFIWRRARIHRQRIRARPHRRGPSGGQDRDRIRRPKARPPTPGLKRRRGPGRGAGTCLAFIWRRARIHLATGADSSAANQGEAAPARAVWRAGSRPDQATEGETADSRIEAKARTWPGRGNVPKLRRRARTDPKRSWRIRR